MKTTKSDLDAPLGVGPPDDALPVDNLRVCRASFDSFHGPIRVEWATQDDGRLRVEVEVPEGARAQAMLPGWDDGQLLMPGVHVLFA